MQSLLCDESLKCLLLQEMKRKIITLRMLKNNSLFSFFFVLITQAWQLQALPKKIIKTFGAKNHDGDFSNLYGSSSNLIKEISHRLTHKLHQTLTGLTAVTC